MLQLISICLFQHKASLSNTPGLKKEKKYKEKNSCFVVSLVWELGCVFYNVSY